MRERLEKRLSYLYTGESIATIGFLILSFFVNHTHPHLHLYSLLSFCFSFFLLEFILAQGSVYWYTKWRRLKSENTSLTPIRIVKGLKRIQKWNVGLIGVTPFMFVFDILRWHTELPLGGLYVAGFIYFFSLLEYINYFHIQLSYDNRSDVKSLIKSRKLKQAVLNKDFKRLN